MKVHFTRIIWDEAAKKMVAHQFELMIDPSVLPITMLLRAKSHKRGLAHALHNAVTLKHTGALKYDE